MLTTEKIDQLNQKIYTDKYSLSQISLRRNLPKSDYFQKLVKIRFDLLRGYGLNKKVLDIGCATGDYLLMNRKVIKSGIGIDTNNKAIKKAITKKNKLKVKNIDFVKCSAKKILYKNNTFDLIFSYCTLYFIPQVEKVIIDIERLLKPKSIAILEFGNLYSLNTLVCKAYPEMAIPCHIGIKDMREMIEKSGLTIIDWRRFQILPIWGSKPKWLKPLLHPVWKKILQKEIKNKMIDEWISNAPLLKHLAFRHIIVCKKE